MTQQSTRSANMSRWQKTLALLSALAAMAAILLDVLTANAASPGVISVLPLGVFLVLTAGSIFRKRLRIGYWVDGLLAVLCAYGLLQYLELYEEVTPGFWLALFSGWLLAWLFVERLTLSISRGKTPRKFGTIIPAAFGAALLIIWETGVRGGHVPTLLLPAPSGIWDTLISSTHLLAADFQQTFKAVLIGYVWGCGAGFIFAIAIDRSPFLKRGLLPLGNFVSALPLIGIAPIMVMWFGFDWPSKAAVVVIMTFFPMLVNTISGLNESNAMERDLMRTYAANYWQTLFKLRLPAAAPFIFNALKINSTLALIGAIVAEFFGTPIVGMGFRISSEIGKLNVEMVWAEIAVAALAGSAFYGVVALLERAVTFWHPSVRSGRAY